MHQIIIFITLKHDNCSLQLSLIGPRQANLVLIAYASSEGLGEPAEYRQNFRCSLIQAVSQKESSDRKPDPWPLWMAGHTVKICHDGMIEDTNWLDPPQL